MHKWYDKVGKHDIMLHHVVQKYILEILKYNYNSVDCILGKNNIIMNNVSSEIGAFTL